MLKIPVWFSFC